MAKQYCVVFNSTSKNTKSKLVDRTNSKTVAETETRRLNKGQGMGGWYSSHLCRKLGAEFRKEIGLEGRKVRR